MNEEEFEDNLKQIQSQIKYFSKRYYIFGLESDDIGQEIRIRLWNKREIFNPSKGSFRNWAYSISVNLLRNLYRDSKRHKREPLNYIQDLKEEL